MGRRLCVLGATGRTGHEIVTGALREGHDVTALVRDRSRLTIQDPRLRVMVGSATDAAGNHRAPGQVPPLDPAR